MVAASSNTRGSQILDLDQEAARAIFSLLPSNIAANAHSQQRPPGRVLTEQLVEIDAPDLDRMVTGTAQPAVIKVLQQDRTTLEMLHAGQMAHELGR